MFWFYIYKGKECRITAQLQLYLCISQPRVLAIYSYHQAEYRTINKKNYNIFFLFMVVYTQIKSVFGL